MRLSGVFGVSQERLVHFSTFDAAWGGNGLQAAPKPPEEPKMGWIEHLWFFGRDNGDLMQPDEYLTSKNVGISPVNPLLLQK